MLCLAGTGPCVLQRAPALPQIHWHLLFLCWALAGVADAIKQHLGCLYTFLLCICVRDGYFKHCASLAGVADAIKQHLLPLATIVTPNIPEACKLLGGGLHISRVLPFKVAAAIGSWGAWTCLPALHGAWPESIRCAVHCGCGEHPSSAWPCHQFADGGFSFNPPADGRNITDVESMRAAAEELHRYGPQVSCLFVLAMAWRLLQQTHWFGPQVRLSAAQIQLGASAIIYAPVASVAAAAPAGDAGKAVGNSDLACLALFQFCFCVHKLRCTVRVLEQPEPASTQPKQ